MSESTNQILEMTLDLQKKWAETAMKMSSALSSAGSNPKQPLDAAAWMEQAQKIMAKGMADSGASPSSLSDLSEQLEQAASTYASLLGFAQAQSKKTDNAAEESTEANDISALLNQYQEMLSGWMPSEFAPPGMASAEAWQKASTTMMGNWARLMTDLTQRATDGFDAKTTPEDAVQGIYASWLKSYEATLGRFVNMPAVGPQRYSMEKLEKSTDTYLKYQAANSDFQSKITQTGIETLQEVTEKAEGLFSEKIEEETFDEFYALLMSVGERRYRDLFSTPLFCQSLEALVATGLDFLDSWNDLTEETLKSTPIVTQSQADEMHKEIYLLKKRLSQLEQRLGEQDSQE